MELPTENVTKLPESRRNSRGTTSRHLQPKWPYGSFVPFFSEDLEKLLLNVCFHMQLGSVAFWYLQTGDCWTMLWTDHCLDGTSMCTDAKRCSYRCLKSTGAKEFTCTMTPTPIGSCSFKFILLTHSDTQFCHCTWTSLSWISSETFWSKDL